ncbi:hypothetical protein K0651_03610 [Ornithinimicrobium sp. Arc0846-15]|nr:hypothetical protein [Ornithinimicrobium laminariae]
MTDVQVELKEGEQLVGELEEIGYRQITPHLLRDGRQVATSAFGPSTADAGKPSYSRSLIVTAQEARDWHSANARKPSEAVYGVSVGEVIQSGSVVVDDSDCPIANDESRAPGHCFVDFRGLPKPEERELRAKLYMHAMERGEIPTEPLNQDGALFSLPDSSH